MASGSGRGGGQQSVFQLMGGRNATGGRLTGAGGRAQSVRSFYKEMRAAGASRSEAKAMARTYAASTRRA